MSLTNQSLVDQARSLVPDPNKTKMTDAQFIPHLQSFVNHLAREHKEALLNAAGTLDPTPTIPDDVSGNFPLPDEYATAAHYWLAWRYYSSDTEDKHDKEQAGKYLALWKAELGEE